MHIFYQGLLFLFPFYFQINLYAQENYPKDYFRSPLDIPIILSGNFGELRSNHFHAGLDMKTEGVEGKKVYAVADGHVSRIKVSPWGYGKAIYITHPNGYVSVYAHLKSFNDSIGRYVKESQYREEQFEVELHPLAGELPVSKGDVIALSGNTGGSGGPHLHFEIRDEKTEHPINPFHFGFEVSDNVKPLVNEIIIYPLSEYSEVNGSEQAKRIALTPMGNSYTITQPVTLQGKIGFGISTYDRHSGASNPVGVYSIELKVDGERRYFHQMDRFSFEHSRCLNSHTDYQIFKKSKNWFHKSFVAPNNKLSIYHDLVDQGMITFDKDSIHQIDYIIKDFKGNTSDISFKVRSKAPEIKIIKTKVSAKVCASFICQQENQYKTEDVSISFPDGIFYDDLDFIFFKEEPINGSITSVYNIHNEYVPVHSTYNLSIKIDSLDISHRRKALIVHIDGKGGKTPIGGDLRNNWLSATPKIMGKFTVMIDSVPPVITPLNSSKQNNIRELKFKITDDLSGVKSFRGTIDGKWVLMEYDPKQALLFHQIEKELKSGKHQFQLEVKDSRGNISEYSTEFLR